MKQDFQNIYKYIIESKDELKMQVLGSVLTKAMDRIIDNNPTLAKEYIELLESVRWKNYLTDKETDRIISDMIPKPYWSRNAWESKMKGKLIEENPYFNTNSLYATMSMITSDSGDTLQKVVTDESLFFQLVYDLALDKLKDKDSVFNIRKYFGLYE